MSYKVLNLYACLGGNRYKWTDCEVTAVELDPEIAELYKKRFPQDHVIVGDAHQYLLDHYKDFDFIWSSPPCPTHSKLVMINKGVGSRKSKLKYPDLKLYEEIILLQNFYTGKFCIENVQPYYDFLIPGQKRGRHIFWTNFKLPTTLSYRLDSINIKSSKISELEKYHDIDLKGTCIKKRKDQMLRNLVDYEAGLTIFNTARNIENKSNLKQLNLL